ncbi:MAG TPA: hypothetical protein VM166_10025 [Gemmatimonadaceae bacterium]|nr:hypothetical protein [Gemmatimonadaceae bacterium]
MPLRPFIPSATPLPRSKSASGVQFHLSRPFVHGAANAQAAPSESFVALPSVDDFLDTTSEKAESYANSGDGLDFPGDTRSSYELPPVEHFLDPLPLVDSLAPEREDVLMADAAEPADVVDPLTEYENAGSDVLGLEETGWVDTSWQQFDWSGAAALGEGSAEASDAWLDTDWETTGPPVREIRETAAQAIANALDEIAHRIRNGELVVPPPNLVSDPAAIAATLAALLGVRR